MRDATVKQPTKSPPVPANANDGEGAFRKQRNPFFVPEKRALLCVAGGSVLSLAIYFAAVWWFQSGLKQSIREADTLTQVLAVSPLYPGQPSQPTIQASGEKVAGTPVNDLAIAIWIQNLKLVPPDVAIPDILGDARFTLLIAALRYGDHCEGQRGNRGPLSMTNVQRLAKLAAFFARDCATRSGDAATSEVTTELVAKIATGGFSGKELFKSVLGHYAVFDNLGTPPVRKEDALVAAARMALDAAASDEKRANENPDLRVAANDPKLAAAKKTQTESQARTKEARDKLTDTQKQAPKAPANDFEQAHQARLLLQAFYLFRESNDAKELNDASLGAVDQFATGVIAAIDGDPKVTAARLYLASVWGFEQYLILALFLITALLIIDRYSAFYDYRAQVVSTIAALENGFSSIDREARQHKRTANDDESTQTARRRQRDRQADLSLQRLQFITAMPENQTGSASSELVTDLVRAARSDLSQIHLYGVSDERVDKVSADLKDKLDASRQVIEWGITTLPALGFLGTVRGILLALSAVGGLNQGDNAARLAALLNVSGALGLAFATTLFALVFMIILSYFDLRQARAEKSLVDSFRDYLNDRVLS
jgi:biopolymer transport protein ExbB/TolQ